MPHAKRWRRLFGLFGGGPDGSRTTTVQVAQVVLDVQQNRTNALAQVAQFVPDIQYSRPQTNVAPAQVVIEVLRSMHCVIAPPPVPPAPQCPAEPDVPVGPGGEGCVSAEPNPDVAGGGCSTAVPPSFGT